MPQEPTTANIRFEDLVIRTKSRTLVPFKPNKVQEGYLDDICPNWREGDYKLNGCREIILKARQFGFSTLIAALFFLDTINTANTNTVVIAHNAETTARLFQMIKRFWEYLPPDKKPKLLTLTKGEMTFEHNKSSYYVATAGSKGAGRAQTINNLHGSEIAFWPNGDELATGLLQAITDGGNVFLESTANGVGNFFHSEYNAAAYGTSDYNGRFFAWFQHDEYECAVEDAPPCPREGAALMKEEALRLTYGLSFGQLAWRRKKMTEPGMRSRFVQEYPANALEAFVASGNPYFDNEVLSDLEGVLTAGRFPRLSVDLAEFPRLQQAARKSVVDGSRGAFNEANARMRQLEVYAEPDLDKVYVIGADPAEGLTGAGNHDYCSADVLELISGAQVAHLHGRWEPHEFGLILAELGEFYFNALIAPERNNHGHAVISSLIHTAKYPNLYMHEEFDVRKAQKAKKPGWPQHAANKTLALDTLADAFTNGACQICAPITVREMMTFVKMPGGKCGAEGNAHDDAVISMAIAMMMTKKRARVERFVSNSVTHISEDAASVPTSVHGGGPARTMETKCVGGLFVIPHTKVNSGKIF